MATQFLQQGLHTDPAMRNQSVGSLGTVSSWRHADPLRRVGYLLVQDRTVLAQRRESPSSIPNRGPGQSTQLDFHGIGSRCRSRSPVRKIRWPTNTSLLLWGPKPFCQHLLWRSSEGLFYNRSTLFSRLMHILAYSRGTYTHSILPEAVSSLGGPDARFPLEARPPRILILCPYNPPLHETTNYSIWPSSLQIPSADLSSP